VETTDVEALEISLQIYKTIK